MKNQRGGFALGLIVGLLLGLAVALAVALYVTKTPVPLMNKGQQRTPEQDAAETERNKTWDPNAALAGKPPVRTVAPVASAPASDTAIVPRVAAPVLPPANEGGRVTPPACYRAAATRYASGTAARHAAPPCGRAVRAQQRVDQIPDCQVLGIPALPIASSIARQASRASGCARRLLAMELRNRHMSARFG